MKKHPVISIIGGSIWGNRGAEAMLVTTIGKIRASYPQVRIHVFTLYPKKDSDLTGDNELSFFDSRPKAVALHLPFALVYWLFRKVGISIPLPRPLRAMKQSDVLLDIGGITFADGRAEFLAYNVLTIWPSMLLGVPVVKLSQALGPFKNSLTRTLGRVFLNRCQHVFSRGKYTGQHLAELPLQPSRWSPAADIAFLYRPEYSLSVENEDRVCALEERLQASKSLGGKVVALSPSVLVQEKTGSQGVDYAATLIDMIKKSDAPARRYVVFPNATRAGSKKTRNNDLVAIQAIKDTARETLPLEMLRRIEWVDYDINTSTVRRIVNLSDVLITSRFHAMISGLALCVPTIVIGWSHKYAEAMDGFGLDEFVLDYSQAGQDFSTMLVRLLENNQSVRETMSRRLPVALESSASQFDILNQMLG